MRVICLPVLRACIVSSGMAVAQEGNSVRVVVEIGHHANGALQDVLNSALAGAPHAIHGSSTLSAVISTDTIGYELLLSDPRFAVVRLQSDAAAGTSGAPALAAALTEWTLDS